VFWKLTCGEEEMARGAALVTREDRACLHSPESFSRPREERGAVQRDHSRSDLAVGVLRVVLHHDAEPAARLRDAALAAAGGARTDRDRGGGRFVSA